MGSDQTFTRNRGYRDKPHERRDNHVRYNNEEILQSNNGLIMPTLKLRMQLRTAFLFIVALFPHRLSPECLACKLKKGQAILIKVSVIVITV